MGTYHKYKESKHGAHHSYRTTNSGNIDQRHFTQQRKLQEGEEYTKKHWGCTLLIGIIITLVAVLSELL